MPGSQHPSKQRLRLWIHLLRVTRRIENHMREYLRVHHRTTLPRFDVMAALYRRPDGLTMSELSRMLLVSNGNATTIVDRLVQDGLVKRFIPEKDRRSVQVALTAEGLEKFDLFARDHEREIAARMADVKDADVDALIAILKRLGHGEKR